MTSCKPKPPAEAPPAAAVLEASETPVDNTSTHPIGRLFQPDGPGTMVSMRLADDAIVEGVVEGIYADRVDLKGRTAVQKILRQDMPPSVRAQFYVDDFILQETRGLDDIDGAPKTFMVRETRFAAEDDMAARTGPGRNYRPVEGYSVLKGSQLQVLEERGLWIRVVTTDGDQMLSGWLQRFFTTPLDAMNPEQQERELAKLREGGWVDRVDAENNEAYVHRRAWRESELQIRQGVARSLALYCKQAGSKHLSRVEILEAESGKRLAKYSESLGYKAY